MNPSPYIYKYFEFPVGHPVIHLGDACQDIDGILEKEGLIKCSILYYRFVLIVGCFSVYVRHALSGTEGMRARDGRRTGTGRYVGVR